MEEPKGRQQETAIDLIDEDIVDYEIDLFVSDDSEEIISAPSNRGQAAIGRKIWSSLAVSLSIHFFLAFTLLIFAKVQSSTRHARPGDEPQVLQVQLLPMFAELGGGDAGGSPGTAGDQPSIAPGPGVDQTSIAPGPAVDQPSIAPEPSVSAPVNPESKPISPVPEKKEKSPPIKQKNTTKTDAKPKKSAAPSHVKSAPRKAEPAPQTAPAETTAGADSNAGHEDGGGASAPSAGSGAASGGRQAGGGSNGSGGGLLKQRLALRVVPVFCAKRRRIILLPRENSKKKGVSFYG